MIPLIHQYKTKAGETVTFLKLPLGLGLVIWPESWSGDWERATFRAVELAWFDYLDNLPAHLFDAYTIESPRLIRNPQPKTAAAKWLEGYRWRAFQREQQGKGLQPNEKAFLTYLLAWAGGIALFMLSGLPNLLAALVYAWS